MFASEINAAFVYQDHLWSRVEYGDYEPVFDFHTEEQVEQWSVTVDNDNKHGKSSATLEVSRNKTAVFSGYINTEVPDDGKQVYSGYATMVSPFKRVSSSCWQYMCAQYCTMVFSICHRNICFVL